MRKNGGIIESERLNVYFHERANGKYHPRSILTDFEPGILDSIKIGSLGQLFDPRNLISAQHSGTNNNWAKGYYTYGPLFIDSLEDIVRREVKECDCI